MKTKSDKWRGGKASADRLRTKVAKLNPDTDAVAIFRPNEEVMFYIPDAWVEKMKQDQTVPPYVMSVLMHAHIYAHHDNPVVREFVRQIKQQVLLDLMTNDDDTPIT